MERLCGQELLFPVLAHMTSMSKLKCLGNLRIRHGFGCQEKDLTIEVGCLHYLAIWR